MKFTRIACAALLTVSLWSGMVRAQSPTQPAPPEGKNPSIRNFDLVIALIKPTIGSTKLTQTADALAKKGNWAAALPLYQNALAQWPGNTPALYGLAKCYHVQGNTNQEIACYRAAIYFHAPDPARGVISPSDGFQENNVDRLMEYVLLLSQTGQADEALAVYHRALGLLNYEDGRQHLPFRLPDLGPEADQLPYTPQHLQAMAHVSLAVGLDNQGEHTIIQSHLREAIRLWPSAPAPYFYLGQDLGGASWLEARAAYLQAFQHSSGTQIEVVREALKNLPGAPEYYAEGARVLAEFTAKTKSTAK